LNKLQWGKATYSMQPTPQTKVSILRLENPLKIIFIVGLCLFSMCGNGLALGEGGDF